MKFQELSSFELKHYRGPLTWLLLKAQICFIFAGYTAYFRLSSGNFAHRFIAINYIPCPRRLFDLTVQLNSQQIKDFLAAKEHVSEGWLIGENQNEILLRLHGAPFKFYKNRHASRSYKVKVTPFDLRVKEVRCLFPINQLWLSSLQSALIVSDFLFENPGNVFYAFHFPQLSECSEWFQFFVL